MAITLRLDDAQAQALTQAINDLSNNLGKWQAQQTEVLKAGFTSLITLFGGDDPEQVQAQIDAFTSAVRAEADALEGVAAKDQQSNS